MNSRFLGSLVSTLFTASSVAFAQSSPSPFPDPLAIPYANGHPQCDALAVGDFDGDGAEDAAVLERVPHRLIVFRGHGRDGFTELLTMPLASQPQRIESADMNGDGLPDLVITFAFVVGNVQVLLANHQGSFTALPPVAVGSGPRELALGDLDLDGDVDAVVGMYGGESIFFCRNDGGGTLTSYLTVQLAAGPKSIALGQLDGDPSLDVAVGCGGDQYVLRLLFNDGAGGFPTNLTLFSPDDLEEVEIADFDGDTRADVAFSASEELWVTRGDGVGGFSAPQLVTPQVDAYGAWVDHGDLDHDGDVDLVVSDFFPYFGVARNQGGGTFAVVGKMSVKQSVEGRLVDFDADGHLDLVVAGDNLQVFFGDGQSGFTPEATSILPRLPGTQLAHADIDGDGNLDEIVGANADPSFITVCFGDGQGSITGLQDVALGVSSAMANPGVGDWDGDGDPDVLAATEAGVVVLRNDAGSLSAVGTFDVGAPGPRIDCADFDGDGLSDALVYFEEDTRHTLFRSQGDGTFAVLHSADYGEERTISSTVADLNGDALLDFVIGASDHGLETGRLHRWLSQGTTYVDGLIPIGEDAPLSLATGDFDADGDPDLALLYEYSEAVRVDTNDGSGNLSFKSFVYADGESQAVQARDMDGDGDSDLVVWEGYGNQSVAVFASKGDATFLSGSAHFVGRYLSGDIADMNNDGRPDLVAVYLDESESGPFTALRVMLQSQAPVSIYCSPKTNSLGCVPELTSSGTPSATAGSGFLIGASRIVSGVPALFFYGLSGPNASAFQGGTLCVQPPLVRISAQNAGGSGNCTGVLSTDFNAYIATGQNPSLVAGRRVCGQWWSRDSGFAPPNNTNLTGAIDFVIQP